VARCLLCLQSIHCLHFVQRSIKHPPFLSKNFQYNTSSINIIYSNHVLESERRSEQGEGSREGVIDGRAGKKLKPQNLFDYFSTIGIRYLGQPQHSLQIRMQMASRRDLFEKTMFHRCTSLGSNRKKVSLICFYRRFSKI
jgi:hypothetical protein